MDNNVDNARIDTYWKLLSDLYGYLHYVIFIKCINDYVTDFIVTPDISHFNRELYSCRDAGDFSVLTSTEMSQLLRVYLYNIILMLL